jgi:hypothetical protein
MRDLILLPFSTEHSQVLELRLPDPFLFASLLAFSECSWLCETIIISFAATSRTLTFLPAIFFGTAGRLRLSIRFRNLSRRQFARRAAGFINRPSEVHPLSLRWQKMTLFCHCCHRLAGISIVP